MGEIEQETTEQRVVDFIRTVADAVESLQPELRRGVTKGGPGITLLGPTKTLQMFFISTIRNDKSVPGVCISTDHAPILLKAVPQRFSRWSGLYNACASWLPPSHHYKDQYPTECALFETVIETVAARMGILPTTRLRQEVTNVCEAREAQLKKIVLEPLRASHSSVPHAAP